MSVDKPPVARNLPSDLWQTALAGAAEYDSEVLDWTHVQTVLAHGLEALRRDGYLRTESGGRPGERVEDGGVMGTLVRCQMCGGSGLLHQRDHMPETAAPQPEPSPQPDAPDAGLCKRCRRNPKASGYSVCESCGFAPCPPPAAEETPAGESPALTLSGDLFAGVSRELMRFARVWLPRVRAVAEKLQAEAVRNEPQPTSAAAGRSFADTVRRVVAECRCPTCGAKPGVNCHGLDCGWVTVHVDRFLVERDEA